MNIELVNPNYCGVLKYYSKTSCLKKIKTDFKSLKLLWKIFRKLTAETEAMVFHEVFLFQMIFCYYCIRLQRDLALLCEKYVWLSNHHRRKETNNCLNVKVKTVFIYLPQYLLLIHWFSHLICLYLHNVPKTASFLLNSN